MTSRPKVAATGPTGRAEKKKGCPTCGLTWVGYTPDPCLGGYLPGVAHACCGHGDVTQAYVCGWPGCSPDEIVAWGQPDEYIFFVGNYEPEGYWEYRGQRAIDYLKEAVWQRSKNQPQNET